MTFANIAKGCISALALILCGSHALAASASLPNGGFEATSSGGASAISWTPYGSGYAVDNTISHGGARSLRCQSSSDDTTHGAFCVCTLNQTQPAPIIVTGWSRAQDVDGEADGDYAIYVDLIYRDGSPLYGQTAAFDTGTHGWQQRRVLIVPQEPVKSMTVYALFRNHSGTVWFDDFDASQTATGSLFDGQKIAAPLVPRLPGYGWYIRDVAGGGNILPRADSRRVLDISVDRPEVSDGGNIVRIGLRNLSHRERAVTVYYIERFDRHSPVWWRDIRTSCPATPLMEYSNATSVDVGATGQLSLYPFGCVTSRTVGRALGVPASLGARVVRIAFNPVHHLFYAAFDIALTAAGDPAHHDHATVAIVRYDVDPRWGFRDAAARYFAMFPAYYHRRTAAEGIWMPFTAPQTVQGYKDFHFAFHEGDNSVAADRADGILSFRYVEPMTYWMAMPPAMPRTYSQALALVRSQAADPHSPFEHQAQAVLTSAGRDSSGQFNVSFQNTPWCNGAVWVLNPNPAVPHAGGQWTKAMLNAAAEPNESGANQPDGEYLDSLEAHADVLDYRAASLAASTVPLTFTPSSFRPVIPTWFSVYDAVLGLSNTLHERGRLLMANTTPWRFFALDPRLDVLGTEINPFTAGGEWAPESDAIMNLRRTLAADKPYLLLVDTNFSKVSYDDTRKYFERSMFYGMFPSMFSADAADNPFWQDPALYDRDRPLFKAYIPVICRLSAAGWQPVTLAVSNNPNVWVERFGAHDFTLLNPSDEPQTATVTIDCMRLFGRNGSHVDAFAMIGAAAVRCIPDGRQANVTVTLQPDRADAISLRVAAAHGIAPRLTADSPTHTKSIGD